MPIQEIEKKWTRTLFRFVVIPRWKQKHVFATFITLEEAGTKFQSNNKGKSNLQMIPDLFNLTHYSELRYIRLHTEATVFLTRLQSCRRRVQFQTGKAELVCSLSATLGHDSIFHTQTYPGDLKAGSRV